MKPWIGITTYEVKANERTGYESATLQVAQAAFTEAVAAADGVPVLLPQVRTQEEAAEGLNRLDGLLIIGGHDVSPAVYQAEPKPGLDVIDPARDVSDLAYFDVARTGNLPVLGICRGMQLINAHLGGTLYQDLSNEKEQTIQHVQKQAPEIPAHSVDVRMFTSLYDAVKADRLIVNTFHHQAIKDLAPELSASAHSADGLIEAVEAKDSTRPLLGVQWHPEMLFEADDAQAGIFEWLIRSARTYHREARDVIN